MPRLTRPQVHALAATVGLLEARLDIERIQGTQPPFGLEHTPAQLCYRALSTAFPELDYLFDEDHLGQRAEDDRFIAEPCS